MNLERIALWDLPTRLFHWLLVILIVAAVVTAKIGGNAMDWHGRIGLSILGLIVFRLVWGFIGSQHARFASFIPTPSSVRAYLRGQWHGVGHNPLGAFSVFALLALVGLQVGSGLFSNDDIAFSGPLAGLISKALSDQFSGIHEILIKLLMLMIALHLVSIAFYTWVKKESLVKPMITGWKDVPRQEGTAQSAVKGGGARAFIVALLIASAAVFGASGLWMQKTEPPPSASSAPADW